MALYKYTVFGVECLSSAIAPHKLLHFDMPRYSWPLSETYLLGSSNKIQYHVTDLNILARANLHGSIEGAPKDQPSLAAHIFVVPKILGFKYSKQKVQSSRFSVYDRGDKNGH